MEATRTKVRLEILFSIISGKWNQGFLTLNIHRAIRFMVQVKSETFCSLIKWENKVKNNVIALYTSLSRNSSLETCKFTQLAVAWK